MELYYKNFISADGSLNELVDDLLLIVQGAEEFVEAAGARLDDAPKNEITGRLQQLKESCRIAKQQAIAGALAANKVMRQYPYSSAGFAFAFGLLAGALLRKRR